MGSLAAGFAQSGLQAGFKTTETALFSGFRVLHGFPGKGAVSFCNEFFRTDFSFGRSLFGSLADGGSVQGPVQYLLVVPGARGVKGFPGQMGKAQVGDRGREGELPGA
mgnify:CR=1 FL=1